jgi:hypothetical protein
MADDNNTNYTNDIDDGIAYSDEDKKRIILSRRTAGERGAVEQTRRHGRHQGRRDDDQPRAR